MVEEGERLNEERALRKPARIARQSQRLLNALSERIRGPSEPDGGALVPITPINPDDDADDSPFSFMLPSAAPDPYQVAHRVLPSILLHGIWASCEMRLNRRD